MARPLQCPYILSERIFDNPEELTVKCEDSCRTFKDREAATDFVCRYCASSVGWRRCSWARELELYYDREVE